MKDIVTRLIDKVVGGVRYVFRPLPSFFDIAVIGFLAIAFIMDSTFQKVFFVFYIIFLLCLTMAITPKRRYKSIPLALLMIWGLVGVFVHSYTISEQSVTYKYLTLYLLSEGLIYMLFGSLLVRAIVQYSTNARFILMFIPIAVVRLFYGMHKGRLGWSLSNITFYAAIAVSVIVYLVITNRGRLAKILAMISTAVAACFYSRVMVKFACRVPVWRQLIKEIVERPLFGSGYNKTLLPDNLIFVDYQKWGWLYRHNDYLSIGAYLGIIATICATWFAVESLIKIGKRPALIPFLAITLMCFFQMNMFLFDRASVYLVIGGLCLRSSIKQWEEAT